MHEQKKVIDLLTRIVHEYIVSGHPVGSLFLTEKHHLPFSSATLRNIMSLLEAQGHLTQPHASAGRVPTQEGYRAYVQNMRALPATKRQKQALTKLADYSEGRVEDRVKKLTKALSSMTSEIAFSCMGRDALFTTGFSNLCEKPEFADRALIAHISEILDSLDETIARIYSSIGDEPEALIGSREFSDRCSLIVVKFHVPGGRSGLIGILGPLRMHYARNIGLVRLTKSLIEESF